MKNRKLLTHKNITRNRPNNFNLDKIGSYGRVTNRKCSFVGEFID